MSQPPWVVGPTVRADIVVGVTDERMTADEVARIVAGGISADEAQALMDWYAALAANVARFPAADLKQVEPPLQSTPGPQRP